MLSGGKNENFKIYPLNAEGSEEISESDAPFNKNGYAGFKMVHDSWCFGHHLTLNP